mgnify:CR=1 FL=1|jgi:glycosyltransferase involved in cell wall biosynthesis|tara:strand:+ start:3370 stop:4266 length:897 start_codon:yes stop_codon:yes gene_type:complete
MLAVCIPVYNQDVSNLVKDLLMQKSKLEQEVSIVVIDDHSSQGFQKQYDLFSGQVKVIKRSQNIGRSKIRNAFLEHTEAKYLLFLDCDSQVIRSDFLSKYIERLQKEETTALLFGASIYQSEKPNRKHRLRWKYGALKESKRYSERLKKPNLSFKTNNFLIERDTFSKHRFNEKIIGYGHEDTLFGFQLEQNKIEISHIDNPVLNAVIDTNSEFLNKTDEALRNLIHIWELTDCNVNLLSRIRILKIHQRLSRVPLVSLFFMVFLKPSRFMLQKGVASLVLFDLYKLSFLLSLKKNTN